jgi:membrane protein YdbS with pleckstrin-like domain
MRYKFNQQAAIWTFVAVVMVWVIAVGVSRLGYDQEPSIIGSLIYGILGLLASLITGLIVQKKKPKKIEWTDDEFNKIKKRKQKNE